MSFWDRIVRYFERRPYDAPAPPPPPAARPAPPRKEIVKPRGSSISPGAFEALVVAHAKVLTGGGPVSAFHYSLARNQVQRDLASKGVTVMDGERAEAAREAGGADKL